MPVPPNALRSALSETALQSSGCESQDISYIFGLAGTKPLGKKVEDAADAIRTERAVKDKDVISGFAETKHRAGSWTRSRRVVARIEATRLGCDRRYVVTNIKTGTAQWLYDSLYCARGQAENLIKFQMLGNSKNVDITPDNRSG